MLNVSSCRFSFIHFIFSEGLLSVRLFKPFSPSWIAVQTMRQNLNLTGADQTKPRPSAGREMPLAGWQKVLTGPAPLNAGSLLLFTNYRAKQRDRVSAGPGWINFTITRCGTIQQNTKSVFKSILWNLFISHRVTLEKNNHTSYYTLILGKVFQSIPVFSHWMHIS